MLKRSILFSLALLPGLLLADSQSIGGQWLGLNNGDASILISDNEAQSLQDVDITENASAIKKREGYAQFKTIGISTWGVRGGYFFRDSNGTDTIVHVNDRSIYESVASGAYSAFVTTDTAGSYYDFTDSNGYLWRANSNRDEILRYDGTTKTYYPSAPKGNQIEALPDRLAIAGTTANQNRIHKSEKGDFTNFATGTEESDPYTEDIGLPGQAIQAIKYFCRGLLVWTKNTISLDTSESQYDLNPIIGISNTVGTKQPNSIVDDLGFLYWQGQDNHFYSYDCNSVRKISRKVDVSGIVNGESRNWQSTTQADFTAGTIGTGLSATSSPGDVVFADVTIDNFSDGDYTSSPAWTLYDELNDAVSVDGERVKMVLTAGLGTARAGLKTSNTHSSTGAWKTDYTHASGGIPIVKLCGSSPSEISASASDSCYAFTCIANGALCLIYRGVTDIGTGSTSFINGNTYTLTLQRDASGNLKFLVDNALVVSANDSTYTTISHIAIGANIGGNATLYFDNIKFGYFIATDQSQSFNIGASISAWSPFESGNTLNDGTITYGFYVDSDSSITISNAATFTSSQTITSGSVPSVAVGPYVTWTANFARTSSTQTPSVNDITVNWSEGAITRHFGIVDKDHRIVWSVAEGTATVPNVSYLYDPRFDTWLKYSFPLAFGATTVNNSIYFGGVSTGVVYNWPSGNTDSGSAITAFWKSKDFISPDPFIEKDYLNYSFVSKAQTGSNLDIIYTLNTSSSTTNNFSLTDSNGNTIRRVNSNFPSGKFATFFNIRFGNDDADAPFEVYVLKYDYKPRPWRVLQ